jgi:hypothetical protein
MSDAIAGRALGAALVQALGLEGHYIIDLTLHVSAEGLATVEYREFLRADRAEPITHVLRLSSWREQERPLEAPSA